LGTRLNSKGIRSHPKCKKAMNFPYRFFLAIAAVSHFPIAINGQISNINFPKEIVASTGEIITVFQPQPETFSGNVITGRSAVSIRQSRNADPVFGAVFYEATISTDKDNRIAQVESVEIKDARFPGVQDEAQLDRLITEVEAVIPRWNMRIPLDALVATVENDNAKGNAQYKTDPPRVFFRDRPTALVIIDGDPQIQRDEDLDADRVVNTPALIFREGNQWNMYNGGIWYRSNSITSGWTRNNNLSAKVRAVNEQVKKQEIENNDGQAVTETPQVVDILVSTEPSELLQTEGTPNYSNIPGTSLLFASNTTDDLFKDINTQRTYTLLSGRWFEAASVEGPWTFVPADQLPPDFAKIPEGSDKDNVLVSVAGTPAAQEARMDAQIPQTAKVDRNTATISVSYDGAPQFQPIEGTSLRLAENSNVTVMQDASGRFFALDNGIWFVSNTTNGPWVVANERPRDEDNIPPSSPAYNTRYVFIYQTTPQFVWVGYTPGFMGSFIFGPTIIFGTGWHYRPWFRTRFFPRPWTWGFGFRWNPWTGWSFGFGHNVGFMHVGFRFGPRWSYGGWFGPPMWRPPYRPFFGGGYFGMGGPRRPRSNVAFRNNMFVGPGRSNIYRNHRGVTTITNRPGPTFNNRPNRPSAGNRPSTRPTPGTGPGNAGSRPGGNNRPAPRPSPGTSVGQGNPPPSRPGGAGGNNRPPGRPAPGTPVGQGNPPSRPGGTGSNNRPPGRPAPGTPIGATPGSRPNFQQRPSRESNNVFADRDGNVFQRDQQGNWNQRNNQNRTWQRAASDNPALGQLNRDQQMRDRGSQRTNNFNQQRSAPAPASGPAPGRQPAQRPVGRPATGTPASPPKQN
jgi:hypothetical protein